MELTRPRLILDMNLPEMEAEFQCLGEPAYRARQVWEGLYKHLWAKPEEFTNLPLALRGRLAELYSFTASQTQATRTSSDGRTQKNALSLWDESIIEAVRMDYDRGSTLCISTQAGCAMGCKFCATGQMGFVRNLSAGEIIDQVLCYARELKGEAGSLSNIVIMGMGEPFLNYENTIKAIDTLNDPRGLNLGERRFTISTVGIAPQITRFADEKRQINLAISLHTIDDSVRNKIIPANRKYPVAAILDAVRYYVDKTRRRITFEWALIAGVNDSREQAQALAVRVKGLLCHVNLIQLNPTSAYEGKASRRETADEFKQELETHGIPCTVRLRRGLDIQAGCGQLATSLKTL